MGTKIKPMLTINPAEIVRRGEEIYQNELREKLEKEYLGKFVAIEINSKNYFLGETQIEATEKARKKFPDKVTYLIKIGFPAVITMSNRLSSSSYGSIL